MTRRSVRWWGAVVVLVAGLGGAAQASGARTPTSPGRVESNGAIAAASALRFVAVAPQADTSTEVGQSVAAGEVSYIVADASPTRVAFLRFDLSSLRGPMASGVLRLHVSQDPTVVGSDSDSGGSVYAVGNGVWSELTTTAATQPAIDGLRGDTVGPVVAGQWVEFDVSRLTREGGIVSLAIVSTSVDGVRYDSRESKDFAPELRVAVGWPARLPAGSMVVAAVGDLACPASTARSSAECHQRDVSDAIIRDPEVSAFFALGDLQYPGGALADFQTGYEASFGRFKDITYPAVGNHEYITPGATGYFSYFGASAGDPSRGYYSFDLGTSWHVVSLNSNCTVVSCSAGSAQEQWLRADLAATARPCTILMWHHPRFSSSSVHGNDPAVAPMWQAAVDAHVDLVLTGHDHTYERFAGQNNDGTPNPIAPLEFVVGSGGRSLYPFGVPATNSEVRVDNEFGFLRLVLNPGSYSWQFLTEDRSALDSGARGCWS